MAARWLGRLAIHRPPEVPSPSIERADDAGSRRDVLWTITQQLHELTSDFSKVSTKTDRLVEDMSGLSKDAKVLHNSLQLAKDSASRQ
jgi:hypothetical protein